MSYIGKNSLKINSIMKHLFMIIISFVDSVLAWIQVISTPVHGFTGSQNALVKYGEFVADIRGKINGTVHSRNKAGAYMRNLVIPTNPQTPAQQAARNLLSSFSQGWRALTQAERDSWDAAAVNFPSSNVFGDPRTLSGNSLYIQINSNISNASGVAITTPPAPIGADGLTLLTVTATAGPDVVSVAFAPDPVPADHTLIIDATANISAGINNFNSLLRQIGTEPATTVSPSLMSVQYAAKFGALVVGMKVGVRAKLIRVSTGEVSQTLTATTIVV